MALVKKNGETMLDARRNVVDYVNEQCGYSIGSIVDGLYDSNDDWDKVYDLYDEIWGFLNRGNKCDFDDEDFSKENCINFLTKVRDKLGNVL